MTKSDLQVILEGVFEQLSEPPGESVSLVCASTSAKTWFATANR